MESNGMPGQVNISSAVYEVIKNEYACIYRGKIHAKNVGEIDMYFIDRPLIGLNGPASFEELEKKESQEPAPLVPSNLYE